MIDTHAHLDPDEAPAVLARARDAGVDRVVFGVPPEAKDKVLPILDKGAAAMKAAA